MMPRYTEGVEAQAALVGAEGAVELHPHAPVDVDLAPIVLPRHPEDDLALRLADALDHLVLDELRVPGDHRPQRLQDLEDRTRQGRPSVWIAPV